MGGRNWCQILSKTEKYMKNIVLVIWRNLFHGGMYCCICVKTRYLFSAFICYIDHFINQKESIASEVDQVGTLYHNFGALCCDNSTQTFLKRRMMLLFKAAFLWEFLVTRHIVARLKTSFSWINENFGKLFEKKN